jgi:hypothetical protein
MRCADVHGFNYGGSWGTSGLDLWQHHDHGLMAVEVARGKRYFPGWNVARWWLSEQAFQRNPERFLANFEAGLSLFAQHDILVMPLLFNRWRDPVCDFGGVALEHIVPSLSTMGAHGRSVIFDFDAAPDRPLSVIERLHLAYVEAVVGAHAGDTRIFAWDLCNEPLMGPYVTDADSAVREAEVRWLAWIYRTCKRIGAVQPLTVGNYVQPAAEELTEPISDFLSIHPYYIWNAPNPDALTGTKERYEAYLDSRVAFARNKGKELLATETVWGATDDARHLEVMRYTLGALKKRGIGFLVHALQHSLVADLHYASFGPVGWPEVLHFVNPDGSLRAGHQAFNEYC